MNRLYGRVDIDTFLGSWVPIMHIAATKGTIFNQARILTSALKMNIHTTKNLEKGQPLEFYMASYILEVVCEKCEFEEWIPKVPEPVYIYYKSFWNPCYKDTYETIAESFIAPLYQMLFSEDPQCMSEKARYNLIEVAD